MPDRKLIDECVHCGFCLPACPTYRSWGQEMDSPRGRIYLMKARSDGRVPLAEVVQHFDRCLGCLACVTACPSGVRYDELIERAREEVEREHRRGLFDRLLRSALFFVLPHVRRLRWLALLGWVYQSTGIRWILRRLGVFRLLPLRLRNLDTLAPAPSWRALWARLPRFSPGSPPRQRAVAVLPGCVQAVYFSNVNAATVRVLTAEGCDVHVPEGLGCCGALSLHAGRRAEAQRLSKKAIGVLEGLAVDAIVVNAAGCGSAMKNWPRLFDEDPTWQARARAVAAKIKDVTEFCAELPPRAPRNPLSGRVAYHDACHLSHGQGIRSQPRALLASIPGIELVDIPDPEQCCGSAGIYNILEPASAREIGRRKAENISSAAPDILVSANPGCTLQIESHLAATGTKIRTAHPIELLDASIRGERL